MERHHRGPQSANSLKEWPGPSVHLSVDQLATTHTVR